MRMYSQWSWIFTILTIWSWSPAYGQVTAGAASSMACLNLQVIDNKTGEPVTGLTRNDLVVVGHNATVPVSSLNPVRPTFLLLYLLDDIEPNGVQTVDERVVNEINEGLKPYIREDQVSTAQIFRGGAKIIAPFGQGQKVARPLSPPAPFFSYDPDAYKHLQDLTQAIEYLGNQPGNQRRVLLVYSYQIPELKGEEVRQLITKAVDKKIAVYWLSCLNCDGRPWPRRVPQFTGGTNYKFDYLKPEILTALTGGEFINRKGGYRGERRITEGLLKRLRNSYELSFQPPASLATDTPQLIEVKLAPHLKHKEKEWRVIAPRAVIVPKP